MYMYIYIYIYIYKQNKSSPASGGALGRDIPPEPSSAAGGIKSMGIFVVFSSSLSRYIYIYIYIYMYM